MKKVILMAAAAVMVAMGANAQGKVWVGGTLGFNTIEEGPYKVNAVDFAPEVGYNITDKWGVGLGFGFSQVTVDNGQTEESVSSFGIAPFARYTFLKWKALSVFADGGFSFSSADAYVTENDFYPNTDVTTFGLFVNPGFSLKLSKCCALVGKVNLFNLSSENVSDDQAEMTTTNCSLNSPLGVDNIQLGFNLTF
jgi:hypothetical protein